jgi:hypothetical protein
LASFPGEQDTAIISPAAVKKWIDLHVGIIEFSSPTEAANMDGRTNLP